MIIDPKIGQKVRYIRYNPIQTHLNGQIGYIISFRDSADRIVIMFSNPSLASIFPLGYGCYPESLELASLSEEELEQQRRQEHAEKYL